MRFPPVHPQQPATPSSAVLCPSVPPRAVLLLPSQCQPRHSAGSPLCLLPSAPWELPSLSHAVGISLNKRCCVLQTPPSPCWPQAGASGPPGPVLGSIWSPCLSQAPLSLSEAQPSLPQLEAPVQLPGFCCNTHSNLSSFQSLNLQQLPPEGWGVQFLCQYLCPSRRFQELQLSLTSVQCSIKWTVYGNKFKMFTILYILYI